VPGALQPRSLTYIHQAQAGRCSTCHLRRSADGRPLLVIVHVNVRSFAVLHRVERMFLGIDPDNDLLAGPFPSGRPEMRNPIIGIVARGLVDARNLNIGHSGFLRLIGA
jgi:hypothetical protein